MTSIVNIDNDMHKEPLGIRILIGLKCCYLVDILRGENLCTSEFLFASITFLTISILVRFYLGKNILRMVYKLGKKIPQYPDSTGIEKCEFHILESTTDEVISCTEDRDVADTAKAPQS